jgi:hypothetical protein
MQGLGCDIKPQSNYQPPVSAKMGETTLLLCPKNECQQSVNVFCLCIIANARAALRHYAIIELSAAFLGENCWDNIATMSWKSASTEHQRLLAFLVGKFIACTASVRHNRTTDHLCRQKCFQHLHKAVQVSVNWVSTILGVASWKIYLRCDIIDQ